MRNIFLNFFLISLGFLGTDASPKEIHLAGIFPINGVEGWQGGQVSLGQIRQTGSHMKKKIGELHFYDTNKTLQLVINVPG